MRQDLDGAQEGQDESERHREAARRSGAALDLYSPTGDSRRGSTILL